MTHLGKPHLGFIAPTIYPNVTGGMEIFNYYLILALKDSYQITLFTSASVAMPPDVNVRIFSVTLLGLSAFKAGLLWFMIRVASAIRRSKQRPDFLHVPFTSNARFYGLVLPYIAKSLKIPYLVSVHGGGLGKWKPKRWYKDLFVYSSQIVAVSDVIQQEYQRRTGRKVNLILPLIPFFPVACSKSELRARLNIEVSKIVILFLGSLKEIKRPLDLVEALYLLGRDYLVRHQILAVFVGDGYQRGELAERIEVRGLTEHTRIWGKVAYEQTSEFYALSDLYVIPSRFEGTSKSMLGAMYYNLVIIGSNVAGINNVIKNEVNGLLFEFGNAHQLALAIRRLIEDDELRIALARRAYHEFETSYSFEKTVGDFKALYCSMESGLNQRNL